LEVLYVTAHRSSLMQLLDPSGSFPCSKKQRNALRTSCSIYISC
jgi:hypothetical protein